MEMVSCKVYQSHYSIWQEGDRFHVEDVEAHRILAVSEFQLVWFCEAVLKLLRGPEDRFYQKFGDLDKGRLMLSKFKTKLGWVLSCDFWPKLGHSTLMMCSQEDKQGWKSFQDLLEIVLS